MKKTMVSLIQSAPGVLAVQMGDHVVGTIASGELWEDCNGDLRYRANKRWVIIGREYQKFHTMWKAAQALCRYVRNKVDAGEELYRLQSGEGFLPVFKTVPKSQKSEEYYNLRRKLKAKTKESKLLYHDALKHAGYSKFVY